MTRRNVLIAGLAAGAASSGAQAASKSPVYYELCYFRLRTDHSEQLRRTTEFLTKSWLPAARRAGAGPIGLFSAVVAADAPFILRLAAYPSMGAIEAAREKLAGDAEYQKAMAAYNANPDPGYIRMESWILRAFDSFPGVENAAGSRAPRVFEMRVYESLNESTLAQKIKMWGEGGELDIFRRVGMRPVWYGEAIAGSRLPHLTYMLAFDNLADREKTWATFQADPAWLKLRGSKEYGTPGLTMNITNSLLTPLEGSDIR